MYKDTKINIQNENIDKIMAYLSTRKDLRIENFLFSKEENHFEIIGSDVHANKKIYISQTIRKNKVLEDEAAKSFLNNLSIDIESATHLKPYKILAERDRDFTLDLRLTYRFSTDKISILIQFPTLTEKPEASMIGQYHQNLELRVFP